MTDEPPRYCVAREVMAKAGSAQGLEGLSS